jgi:hypothetical protein
MFLNTSTGLKGQLTRAAMAPGASTKPGWRKALYKPAEVTPSTLPCGTWQPTLSISKINLGFKFLPSMIFS